MIDLDFKSFSTRSFERFAQALAQHVLGNGLFIFGDGPDGGREAAFDGKLNYPSPADQWSGYTVMQAKFLQVPGDARHDADWLVGQLRKELEKFVDPDADLRRPDYYLLVTNARLSAKPASKRGSGGQAKIDSVFKDFRRQLDLKGWHVWHLDTLNSLLAGAETLRRSYAAWLTGSDVIATLLDHIALKSATFKEAMYRYLARELRSQQPIRLQQAGHGGDARTMIEDVFTDLPFAQGGPNDRDDPERLLLLNLLEWSRDRLDASSEKAQLSMSTGRSKRVLLLGGPGQGKSTVTQFLAQIFRANMLDANRHGEVSPETAAIVESTLSKAAAIDLPVSVPRRFPLRVDLPNFADTLSNDSGAGSRRTLIGYLADQISTIAATSVDIEDLRAWIREYPCAMILDGLDEVPASANRASVIRAINEFWDDAPSADVLMVVTTRPQGYNDDLNPTYYSKLELTPLTPDRAIICADRIAADRIIDPGQRERVLDRLRDAAKAPTTARLMVSPLQVAIMLALIDQRGDAPTDRWSLFDKYFAVVLEREQGKSGPVGLAMRHWGRQIVAVHHKAGFLLHVEAETQGNSEAYLTTAEFSDLVRGQLADEGYEGDELETSTAQLVSSATLRLVLLVQRAEDRFSFEVRSLQEFMAAAHLMTGREATVQARLRTVANRTHWLHVFQIAASKCFAIADAEQYRDTIITLCREFNESGDVIDRLLRTGSTLALALLDDGLAYDQPKYRRLLFSLALEMLEVGPAALPESLSEHCERDPARTVERLKPYFASTNEKWFNAAWKLVMRCAALGQGWASTLLKEIWPDDPKKAIAPFGWRVTVPEGSWQFTRMRAALEASEPEDLRLCVLTGEDEGNRGQISGSLKGMPVLQLFSLHLPDQLLADVRLGGVGTALSQRFNPLYATVREREAYADLPETQSWAQLRAIRGFHEAPNADGLVDLLERASTKGWLNFYRQIQSSLPWPVASLVEDCIVVDDAAAVLSRLRAGSYGDKEGWVRAEKRWLEDGVVSADLAVCASGDFFDHRIAELGTAWSNLILSHGDHGGMWVDELVSLARKARSGAAPWLVMTAQFVLSVYKTAQPLDTAAALDLLQTCHRVHGDRRIDPSMIQAFTPELLGQPVILDRLAALGLDQQFYFTSGRNWKDDLYPILIAALPDRPGLIVLLTHLMAANQTRNCFIDIPQISITPLLSHDVPIVAGHAGVVTLVNGGGDISTIERIFDSSAEKTNPFSVTLLQRCLEHRWLTSAAPQLALLIAQALPNYPSISQDKFIRGVQSVANARLSKVKTKTCWSELELGEVLYVQTTRRREGTE